MNNEIFREGAHKIISLANFYIDQIVCAALKCLFGNAS
jgi:hypothetical protein